MLTKSRTFTIGNDGTIRDIIVTPLFFKNNNEPWQPNEIYELTQDDSLIDNKKEPVSLGKIIFSDHLEWRYEGNHNLSEKDIEQIIELVLAED